MGASGCVLARLERVILRKALLFIVCATSAIAIAADSGSVAEYRNASSRFAALVAAAEATNNGAQLQTGEAQRLVSLLSDEKRFLKAEPYGVKDLGDLVDLCAMSNKAVTSLALFGLKTGVDRHTLTNEIAALLEQNIRNFAGQLRQLQPFLIRCFGREVSPMTEFTLSLTPQQFTDVRRQGLEQVRNGIGNMFTGALQAVGDSKYDQSYRLAMIRALAEAAPSLVQVTQMPKRRELHTLADGASKDLSPLFRPYLDTIRRALENDTCKGLCSL
jgi:hypothetical protein